MYDECVNNKRLIFKMYVYDVSGEKVAVTMLYKTRITWMHVHVALRLYRSLNVYGPPFRASVHF